MGIGIANMASGGMMQGAAQNPFPPQNEPGNTIDLSGAKTPAEPAPAPVQEPQTPTETPVQEQAPAQEPVMEQPQTPVEEAPTQETTDTNATKMCMKCGNINPAGAKFCNNCGNQL